MKTVKDLDKIQLEFFTEIKKVINGFWNSRTNYDLTGLILDYEKDIREDQKNLDIKTFKESGFTLRTENCIRKIVMESAE